MAGDGGGGVKEGVASGGGVSSGLARLWGGYGEEGVVGEAPTCRDWREPALLHVAPPPPHPPSLPAFQLLQHSSTMRPLA